MSAYRQIEGHSQEGSPLNVVKYFIQFRPLKRSSIKEVCKEGEGLVRMRTTADGEGKRPCGRPQDSRPILVS